MVCIYLLDDQAIDVVDIGINEEEEKQSHAHGVGAFEEFIGHAPASDDFPNEEEYVTAIERGDGQEVHKCQNNGKQCGNVPESVPIPRCWEEAAKCAEAAHTLSAALSEEHFE